MNIVEAHKLSSHNINILEEGINCACFSCLRFFPFDVIKKWIDDGRTAICPKCDIDAVIPAKTFNYDIQFLRQMSHYWFT